MTVERVKTLRSDGLETRARLKEAAQRLFAARGAEGVTVQEIVAAAGQRNNAALHYHFGSKTELLAELVLDGAKLIDAHRQTMLDELEAAQALTVRSLVIALAQPLLEIGDQTGQRTYIRTIANLQLSSRAFLREVLKDDWNGGYRRCLAHLGRLLPHLPAPILRQRLSLIGMYGTAIWAAWEAAHDAGAPGHFWAPAHTISNIIDTLQATLETPPSAGTLALIESPTKPQPRGDA